MKRLYSIWKNMKQRCENPKATAYDRYGGRGVSVCDEWTVSFADFAAWAITHGYDDHLTIDRRNNDGHYCPSNCRWVTLKRQQQNKRRRPAQDLVMLGFRCSSELKRDIRDAADRLGVSISDYVRPIFMDYIEKQEAKLFGKEQQPA